MTQPTMNLDERRRADHQLAVQRRQARAEYVEQAEIEAKADADYRRIKSTTFLECRGLAPDGHLDAERVSTAIDLLNEGNRSALLAGVEFEAAAV